MHKTESFTVSAETAEFTREVLSNGNYVTEGGKENSLSDIYILDILAARNAEIFHIEGLKTRVFQLVIPFGADQKSGKIVRGSLGGIVKDDQALKEFFDSINQRFPHLYCESEIEKDKPPEKTHERLLERALFSQVKLPIDMIGIMQEFLGEVFAKEGMSLHDIARDGSYERLHGTGITLYKKLYARDNSLIV